MKSIDELTGEKGYFSYDQIFWFWVWKNVIVPQQKHREKDIWNLCNKLLTTVHLLCYKPNIQKAAPRLLGIAAEQSNQSASQSINQKSGLSMSDP